MVERDLFNTEDTPLDLSGHVPGKVERVYNETNAMRYPNIIMRTDVVETFRMNTLRGILGVKTLVETEEVNYAVYVEVPEGRAQAGYITASRLSILLNSALFAKMDIVANIDEATQFEGDMVHALCKLSSRTLL